MKQHPYYREANKIHPDIQSVRDSVKIVESEQERKIRQARESQEEREDRRRERFLLKHPELRPMNSVWFQGKEGQALPVNQTEGVRMGRKDAEFKGSGSCIPDKSFFGRMQRQSDAGKTPEPKGYQASMRPIEKQIHKGKRFQKDKIKKADRRDVEEKEQRISRGRVLY